MLARGRLPVETLGLKQQPCLADSEGELVYDSELRHGMVVYKLPRIKFSTMSTQVLRGLHTKLL